MRWRLWQTIFFKRSGLRADMAPKLPKAPKAPSPAKPPSGAPRSPAPGPSPVPGGQSVGVATKRPAPGSRIGYKNSPNVGYAPTAAPASAGTDTTAAASDSGGGDVGGGYDPYAAMEAQNQMHLIATVTALFKDYGLESLSSKIIDYVRQGYTGDSIAILLRDTPEYKARFPAMATLAGKRRAISEAAYIDYERTAAQLEKQYGLPTGMVSGNVTGLLENEISATELNDRINMASAASIQAPKELKDTLKKYYNIGGGGLTAYWLDPNMAQPYLEKQFRSALIGAEAVRQGLDVDVYNAQNLEALGVSEAQAKEGFGAVSRDLSFTGGAGETTTQADLISGAFGNQAATAQTERIRQSRAGRFQAGGGFASENQGITGLTTSSV